MKELLKLIGIVPTPAKLMAKGRKALDVFVKAMKALESVNEEITVEITNQENLVSLLEEQIKFAEVAKTSYEDLRAENDARIVKFNQIVGQ